MAAASDSPPSATVHNEKRHRSVFELPLDFFDSCRLISHSSSSSETESPDISFSNITLNEEENRNAVVSGQYNRLTCNTCKAEFDSLQDQRLHFKSDIHRFNVKLSIAGKNIVKEEDFDELTSDSFKDFDVSSISGSEDEDEKESGSRSDTKKGFGDSAKNKLYIRLKTGERISVWKSLLLNESVNILYKDDKAGHIDSGITSYLKESEVVEKLRKLIDEPRDNTCLRIVLLASGGHFAGCVFDGNSVVAHKTFHRYVVRAKAGKKQSSKDASGKSIHSAGAALRRHNELALKKDIQDLLAAWTPYFDAASSIFIHAPSSNRQLLFNGEKAYFSNHHSVARNIPFTIRRPTFKEARRIYSHLTQLTYEADDIEDSVGAKQSLLSSGNTATNSSADSNKEGLPNELTSSKNSGICSPKKVSDEQVILSESESEIIGTSTELHEAAESGDSSKVFELLEQGLDPCVKDERGRTPYMLAKEKEVRNTFRRFMALNLDKWDWHDAKVPSALTKEMEESQAAKQAEKDAKRKARAKELKKLKRAKEKKAQAEAALSQSTTAGVKSKEQSQHRGAVQISKEEELKRAQAAEREKRAAAAERRLAALKIQSSETTVAPSSSQAKSGLNMDSTCSCCNASLAGKVPFHRYNYKYCSTTCMHVHREALEDG